MSQLQPMETKRLIMRQWRDTDVAPFTQMNTDADVMRYFPSTLNYEESQALYKKLQHIIEVNGWGLWALECKATGDFIGFTGLMSVLFDAHFVPAVEVGWRIRQQFWRQGYATEAACAALEYADSKLRLPKVVSFTACQNIPSIGVMQKIGMQRITPDFDHPNVTDDSHLKRHLVYEIRF